MLYLNMRADERDHSSVYLTEEYHVTHIFRPGSKVQPYCDKWPYWKQALYEYGKEPVAAVCQKCAAIYNADLGSNNAVVTHRQRPEVVLSKSVLEGIVYARWRGNNVHYEVKAITDENPRPDYKPLAAELADFTGKRVRITIEEIPW